MSVRDVVNVGYLKQTLNPYKKNYRRHARVLEIANCLE